MSYINTLFLRQLRALACFVVFLSWPADHCRQQPSAPVYRKHSHQFTLQSVVNATHLNQPPKFSTHMLSWQKRQCLQRCNCAIWWLLDEPANSGPHTLSAAIMKEHAVSRQFGWKTTSRTCHNNNVPNQYGIQWKLCSNKESTTRHSHKNQL